jgi:hypothetical protein
MDSIAIPGDVVFRILQLANEFGEPFFSAIEGAGDGSVNGVEAGRVSVIDAELESVADYHSEDLRVARRLANLLNTITHDLAAHVPEELRRRAIRR